MAKKEAQTDIWGYELLKSAHIDLCYQSSDNPEIENALKYACDGVWSTEKLSNIQISMPFSFDLNSQEERESFDLEKDSMW